MSAHAIAWMSTRYLLLDGSICYQSVDLGSACGDMNEKVECEDVP